jgi:hypothetical protein
MGDMRNAYKILVGRPWEDGRRLEDNIRLDLGEIRWEVVAGIIWLRTRISSGL